MHDIEVIIANLHWRYSGGTASNRMLAPRVARIMRARWLGTDRPQGIKPLSLRDLWRLRGSAPIAFHARRNNEMMAGLLLKRLGWPLKLIFTSAAQRHHTWVTRALIRRMDAVITPSAASASYVQRSTFVVHHGVDTELFAPAPDRAAALARAGIRYKYAIGCFGRVRPQKGTDLFVEAMCRLLPNYPDFGAVIVGAVDQRGFARRLMERVRAAGLGDRIRFLGELPIAEVPLWYQRITIYAFTSNNEGFGLTLLEAMASGAALVASRSGAADDVVNDGENGVLVPPNDVEALIAGLELLMRDPQRAARMGARARERVLASFTIDREAKMIAAVYRSVLNGDVHRHSAAAGRAEAASE